jgi:hypothetical protein
MNRKRPRDEDDQMETPEQMLVRENREKAEEQRLIEAQQAAVESEFWLNAAIQIQNVIANTYADENLIDKQVVGENNCENTKVMNA